ncbi:MAG TPA: hypothetical protein PKA57_07800 [Parvibaculum sp.]|uniref:hypothetical protein n=1 Tax=Parvibaculum sp. TaxID=2024848 RepID=UPI002C93FD6C|nr:hypothetical protein [Parvibaculum sp.]HMM14520.1 hypothetical protein [Parvibaculum sp.]
MRDKPHDNQGRRQPGQGPARAQQAREARLAEALRANLRKRKAQAKSRSTESAPGQDPKTSPEAE